MHTRCICITALQCTQTAIDTVVTPHPPLAFSPELRDRSPHHVARPHRRVAQPRIQAPNCLPSLSPAAAPHPSSQSRRGFADVPAFAPVMAVHPNGRANHRYL